MYAFGLLQKNKNYLPVKKILENPQHDILYSQISLLEIAIKFPVGKFPDIILSLQLFNDTLQQKGFTILPLEDKHLFAYFTSTFFSDQHRDPFDRCLLAIADSERVALITNDEKFQSYKNRIDVIW